MANREAAIQAEPVESWEWVSLKQRARSQVVTASEYMAAALPATALEYSPAAMPAAVLLKRLAGPVDRRRVLRNRRVGALMIVAGVVGIISLSGYFFGTSTSSGAEQGQLRARFAVASPQLAEAGAPLYEDDSTPAASTAKVSALAVAGPAAVTAKVKPKSAAQRAAFAAAAKAFAAAVVPGKPIGRIIIPKIAVDVVMVEGVSTSDLKRAPGHWPETAFPGQKVDFVVSGHRTSYGAPFRKLDKLKAGDAIDLVLPYARVRYTVTRVIIVAPDDMDKVKQLGQEQISLVACHPLYSAKQRILVQGVLTDYQLVARKR